MAGDETLLTRLMVDYVRRCGWRNTTDKAADGGAKPTTPWSSRKFEPLLEKDDGLFDELDARRLGGG